MTLAIRDKQLIWHPFTQEHTEDLPIAIKKAKGSYIYDDNDKQYLDLISSWWVNLHGHSHPQIALAIYEQALKLEHVIFAGFTHEPAVQLCESLKELLPPSLLRFFFSDNGSTSVEVAIKMAYQYWSNKGETQRKLFLSFEGGYHGDTFGAMSVSVASNYHDTFKNFFFKVLTVPFPATCHEDLEVENKEQQALYALQTHLDQYSDQIAAFILEPLVQGASGMRMCRPQFVQKALEIVRSKNILVIYDEVMTGFGRTGTIFALDQIGIAPDFLCLSKGITGGFLPLALTITTENIYNSFLSEHRKYAFAHGHSYTANPLSCAAAVESLKLLTTSSTRLTLEAINKSHHLGIEYLTSTCSNIKNTRILGTIAAFEVENIYTFDLNKTLKSKFLEQGLLIRPLRNTIYLLPPYSITIEELEHTYNVIAKLLITL
jgi:adenosylmethionine-8-amino-7-oxononanoate aminotransferase